MLTSERSHGAPNKKVASAAPEEFSPSDGKQLLALIKRCFRWLSWRFFPELFLAFNAIFFWWTQGYFHYSLLPRYLALLLYAFIFPPVFYGILTRRSGPQKPKKETGIKKLALAIGIACPVLAVAAYCLFYSTAFSATMVVGGIKAFALLAAVCTLVLAALLIYRSTGFFLPFCIAGSGLCALLQISAFVSTLSSQYLLMQLVLPICGVSLIIGGLTARRFHSTSKGAA